MTTPTPTPDPFGMVLDAIAQVRADTAAGLAQVRSEQAAAMAALNARLDKLVSMDVHQAEVRRIDGRIEDLASDRGMDRLRSAEAHKELDGKIKAVHEALDTKINTEKAARSSATRWGIGLFVTAIPAVTTFVTLLLK